ncbi:stress-responsive transcription factor hsf1, partial [Rhizophlyctis rosea]
MPEPGKAKLTSLPKSKLSASIIKDVPAFLYKLYNMVDDPSTDELIHWGEDGTTFIVQRHEDLARDVLPRFFKHNNFASFVRQLNMYGFHKVPHLQQGVLQSDGEPERWEFQNDNFQRDQPNLLLLVSRKKGRDQVEDKELGVVDMNNLIQEVAAIKRHQLTISADLKNIQRENQAMWSESLTIRDRYQRQQETIDKILRFLASVFSNKKKPLMNKRRKLLLGQKLPIAEDEVSDDEEEISPVSADAVHQRIVDLMSPPAISPSALIRDNTLGLIPQLSQPSEPSYFDRQLLTSTKNLNNTIVKANEVNENIDLLQDHLQSISDLVGIDGDVSMDDFDNIDMGALLGNDQGTEEDRETLLALMAHHNTPSPPSTTGIADYIPNGPASTSSTAVLSHPVAVGKMNASVVPTATTSASSPPIPSITSLPQTPITPYVPTLNFAVPATTPASKPATSKASKRKSKASPAANRPVAPLPPSTIQLLPTPPLATAQFTAPPTTGALTAPVITLQQLAANPQLLAAATAGQYGLLPVGPAVLAGLPAGTIPILPAPPTPNTAARPASTPPVQTPPPLNMSQYPLQQLSTATLPSLPVGSPQPPVTSATLSVGANPPTAVPAQLQHPSLGLEDIGVGGYQDELERFLAFPEGDYDFLSQGSPGAAGQG